MTDVFAQTGESVLDGMKERTLMVGLGSMKSGTTWLSNYLSSHPDFAHSPIKEMNYFNRMYPNPFRGMGSEFRLFRMEEIILKRRNTIFKGGREKLRALAQLGRIKNHDDFLYYFAERIKNETHFGEISPAYSHIPAQGLQDMLTVTSNVKFIFLMRDPTERAASHIQHLRRTGKTDKEIEEIIDSVEASGPIFRRSDYRKTLTNIDKAGLGEAAMTMFYENMFQDESIRRFTDWLGIRYIEPDFEARYNKSTGKKLSEKQKLVLRDRLDPIYKKLEKRFGKHRPAEWRW